MASNASSPEGGRTAIATVVDAHVHVYDYVGADPAFDIAARNFERCAGPGDWAGMLLIADPATARFADAVREAAARGDSLKWRVQGTSEPCSFAAQRDGRALLLVLGQQLATAEKLEVLAFGTPQPVPDRLPLDETLATVEELGGVSVVPWGLGKWTGRRGRLVEQALARPRRRFFLGDNGGRPAGWSVPQFESAKRAGVRVLRGTDPLPVRGDESRIGTFGFGLSRVIDPERPLGALVDTLLDSAVETTPVGRSTSIARTVSNQILLRARPLASA